LICTYCLPFTYSKSRNFFYRSKRYVYNMPLIAMILRSSSEHHFIWPVLYRVQCSLRAFMDSLTIQPDDKIQTLYSYLEQVISGLDFLHTKRLVHIDVSQDSVMVSKLLMILIDIYSCDQNVKYMCLKS
jgi:serine/threonine protein kinase